MFGEHSDTIYRYARFAMALIGTIAVAFGIYDASTMSTIIGGALTAGAWLWSEAKETFLK